MATTTERIALETRWQVSGQKTVEKVKKDLRTLIRLRDNFNRITLDVRAKGGFKEIDTYKAKLRALTDQLKGVGQADLGKALKSDLGQIDRVIGHARQQIAHLNGEMKQLHSAQSKRPGANLGPRSTELQGQMKAYERILTQAGNLKSVITPAAAEFAKAEARLGSASAGSTRELAAQSEVMAAKAKKFAEVQKAAESFTKSEQALAKQSQRNQKIEDQRRQSGAQGLVGQRFQDGRLQSATFSTGAGQERRISYGDDSESVVDTVNLEKKLKLEQQSIRNRYIEGQLGAANEKVAAENLRSLADEYDRLAAKTRDGDLANRDFYQNLQRDANRARGQAAKLDRQFAERTAREQEKARKQAERQQQLADNQRRRGFGDQRAAVSGDFRSQRRRAVDSPSAQVDLYREEARALRSLAATMRQTGDAGSVQYQQIQTAARKADAEASRLQKTMIETERVARRTAQLAVFSQRADRINQGASNARKRAGSRGAEIDILRQQARDLRSLRAELAATGDTASKEYQRISAAARTADAEASKRQLGEQRAALQTQRDQVERRRQIALDDAARAQSRAINESGNRREIVSDDSAKIAKAYEREAWQLRDLQKQLDAVGLAGTKRYEMIGNAAAKAETKAASINRAINLAEQDRAKRAAFARNIAKQVDDYQKNGYFKKDDRTIQRSDGTSRREVTLFKDAKDLRTYRKAVIELDQNLQPLNATFSTTERQLNAVGNRASWATRNFIDNTKTVVAWASSVVAYQAAFRAIEATTRAVIDLQRSGAVLTAVFQGERAEAERLKTELLDLAVAQGRTGEEALDAGIRFARLGLTRKQILEAVTVSLKAANVAEIDAATAAEQLSSIMAAFNLEVSQLYTVLTRLNNVSNQYNTTNKDLLQGIARVGNLAKETGLELEQLIAIVATGTGLTGRSGAEFGNAIKSIIVSLSNPEIQGKINTLFDIDVRDQAGRIKEMDVLLRDLAISYQFLTGAEKQELLQIVGKKQQAARLAVILQNYTTIQRNLTAALQDGTRTEEENADIRATLLSQLQSLRSAYEQLATSATGAFNDGLVGRTASESIKFLTTLIQLLEKSSGVFPIIAAAAGLFFFKFIRGAIALGKTRDEAGLLVNTLRKLGDVYKDLTLIMATSEQRMINNGGAAGKLAMKLQALSLSGNRAVAMMGTLGRVALFTIGSFAKLLGGLVLVTAAFKVMEKLNDAWADYQKRQEEANRAALGFSTSLNEVADAAKRLEVLKDTASYIREIMDTASDADLSRMIDDLTAIAGENFSDADRDRIQRLVGTGDRGALQQELDRITAATATAELEKVDRLLGEITNDIAAQKTQIEEAEHALANYEGGFLSLLGVGKSAAELKDQIAEGTDNLEKLNRQLKETRDRNQDLRATLRSALVEEADITAALSGFAGQSEAIASLITGDGALGKAIAQRITAGLSAAADANYLSGIEAEFDKNIGELTRKRDAIYSDRSIAAFEAQRRARTEELNDLRRSVRESEATLADIPRLNSPNAAGLDQQRNRVANQLATRKEALAAAEASYQAFLEENEAVRARAREAGSLQANLELEQQTRTEASGAIKQQIDAREREREVLRKQAEATLAYARRLQELQRIQSDTAAASARYRFGRDETERLDNFSTGITNDLAASDRRIRQLRQLSERAEPGSDLQTAAGESLQEELIRAATLANQLEQTRTALVARRAQIEADIVEAKIRQNEEASKALGLASREDQLRAAFLARYQQSNGGRRIDEGTFQFLDQSTRQAVNQFTPSQAPISQGSELDRLQREADRFGNFEQVIANLERSIDYVNSLLVQNAEAAAAGGLGNNDLPAGTNPININVAPGAVAIDIAEPLSRLTVTLSEQINARLDQEIGAIRDEFRASNQSLARAAARGR